MVLSKVNIYHIAFIKHSRNAFNILWLAVKLFETVDKLSRDYYKTENKECALEKGKVASWGSISILDTVDQRAGHHHSHI